MFRNLSYRYSDRDSDISKRCFVFITEQDWKCLHDYNRVPLLDIILHVLKGLYEPTRRISVLSTGMELSVKEKRKFRKVCEAFYQLCKKLA